MDLASIIGFVVCLGMIIFGIVTGDEGFAAIAHFLHGPSFIITVGGTVSCVLAMNSIQDFISGLKSFLLVFKVPALETPQIIKKIIDLSNIARKEGLLSLEEAAADLDDEFLKKGILLIVDGTDPDLVRGILETELTCIEDRHKKRIEFWMNVAAMGPAWGMIGTLIGLILMLQSLTDASTIGPNMSTALITTLYGSMLANWIATPVATKLKTNSDSESMVKEIMIEGLLSIQAGENPRVIEEKLKSFLAPAQRAAASEEEGGEQ